MWWTSIVSNSWRAAIATAAATAALATAARAQNGRITGTVTSVDETAPIPGVQIIVDGSVRRALTGNDGRYTIEIEPGTYTVRALRIGFSPDSVRGVTVAAGEATTVNFTLRQSAALLEGVVVVGYGTQQARDRTGVVETVSADEFNPGRVVSPEQLIQAKVAGVQVVDNGEPGGGMQVRIRGGTSVNASNEPLYVVDGIPLQVGGGISVGRNPLNFLNPNDIESITVLKDASATAIYGSRGANGVVLITTKSGGQSSRLTYTSTASTSHIADQVDFLSAAQFRAAVQEYAPENMALLGDANTNWRDAVQQTGFGQEHTLAFSGAREDMSYRLSLGYLDQEGVVQGTKLDRVSGGITANDRYFGGKLALRTNIMGSRTNDFFTPGSVLGEATAFAPTQPIRDANGNYFEWAAALGTNNPVADLALSNESGTTYRSIGKIEGEYELPFLTATSATLRLAYDVAKGEKTLFYPSALRAQQENSTFGALERQNPTQTNTVLDFFLNKRQELEGSLLSEFDVTAGYSYERTRGDFPTFRAESLATDLLGPNGVPAAKIVRPTLTVDESKLASVFGRVNFTLANKYLFTGTVRRDGSSRFGPGNQWGTFPSAAFAWRVYDEPFMAALPSVSDLKLRVSWGKNGNQAIGNYLQYSSFQVGESQAQVQFGDQFVTTIRPSASDPNIKWEETTSLNVGVDFGLFENRIGGAIDWYDKKTDDLLFNVPVAAGTNLSNFVTTNIGSMKNRGLEFTVNALVLDGKRNGLSWNASFNAAHNTNELTQINAFGGGSEQILVGGIAGGVGTNIEVLQPGFPVNSFFVYRQKRDANGRPVYEDTNGDGTISDSEIYEDLNGDGQITQSDRAPFHSPAPRWIFGHSSQLGYRNFDASFTMRAYRGNYVYNNVASNFGNYAAVRGNAPNNLHASVLSTGFVTPQYFADVYVEDASFIRMDNLSLGYTIRGLRNVNDLRIFGAIQNVFTITDYSGVDPLAGINGIDNTIYPYARIFSAGITVGF